MVRTALRMVVCLALVGLTLRAVGAPGTPAKDLHSFVPRDGFVPDAETAKRIAEAVWIPIYTREVIDQEKPLRARLVGEVWIVEGTLPRGYHGGVAVAEIAKQDGRILRVGHSQ